MATDIQQSVPVLQGSVSEYFPNGFGQNGGRIDNTHIGLMWPTPATTPISEMRERLKADGYLFVKGLIPRKDVLQARER
jgi:phytanoyl-CoA hydroxylase